MRGQLRQIEQRLRRVRQQIGRGKLARLPEALRQYAASGEVPADPLAAAYVRLTEAALDAMNTSVGGDHGQAAPQYQQALSNWQRASRGA